MRASDTLAWFMRTSRLTNSYKQNQRRPVMIQSMLRCPGLMIWLIALAHWAALLFWLLDKL